MTKLFSNNKDALRCILPEDLASSIADFCDRELPTQKALSVYWNAETDKLEVKVNIRGKPCTQHGLLSMIGQTYDPLRLLQPFVPSKKNFAADMPWDELISASGVGEKEWDKWLCALPNLETVSILESFKLIGRCVEGLQLHVFGDASINRYDACAYFLMQYSGGFMQCLFVLGISHVEPLHTVTVPFYQFNSNFLINIQNFIQIIDR